jgi:hypothetical protein
VGSTLGNPPLLTFFTARAHSIVLGGSALGSPGGCRTKIRLTSSKTLIESDATHICHELGKITISGNDETVQ